MSEAAVYAVAGRPILHSRSPELFAAGFRAAGIAGHYTRLAVENAGEIKTLAEALDLAGLNVTAPFKEALLPFLDEIDPDVRRIGAVNTVIRRSGRLIGRNTDSVGVVRALAGRGVGLAGRAALVLGAGGAGRAAVFGLLQAGARVVVVDRTASRAEETAARLGCAWLAQEKTAAAVDRAEIIISCRSTVEHPFDPELLRPDHVVLDARYQGSKLSADAAARGAAVISGRDWLLHQAAAGFTLLTGHPGPVEEMKKVLAEDGPAGKRRKPIALTGFMGAGKSVLGACLARRAKMRLADTDALIESAAGAAVGEIFARDGEAAFRALERAVILELDDDPNLVVSLGGGAVLDPAIRARLASRMTTFWIYSDPAASAAVLPPGSRPLLDGRTARAELAALFKSRLPAYAAAAAAVVLNGRRPDDLENIARRIEYEICCAFPA